MLLSIFSCSYEKKDHNMADNFETRTTKKNLFTQNMNSNVLCLLLDQFEYHY
jgi:hypothetical protein